MTKLITIAAALWMAFGPSFAPQALAYDNVEENGGLIIFFTDYSLLIKDECGVTTVVYIADAADIASAIDEYFDETQPVTFRVKGSRIDMHLEPRGKLQDRLEGFESESRRHVLVVTEAYAEKHGLFERVIDWN